MYVCMYVCIQILRKRMMWLEDLRALTLIETIQGQPGTIPPSCTSPWQPTINVTRQVFTFMLYIFQCHTLFCQELPRPQVTTPSPFKFLVFLFAVIFFSYDMCFSDTKILRFGVKFCCSKRSKKRDPNQQISDLPPVTKIKFFCMFFLPLMPSPSSSGSVPFAANLHSKFISI